MIESSRITTSPPTPQQESSQANEATETIQKDGSADRPPEDPLGEKFMQPDAETIGEKPTDATAQKIFTNPIESDDSTAVPLSNIPGPDQPAIARQQTDETGEATSPEEKIEKAESTPAPTGDGGDADETKEAVKEEWSYPSADAGLIDPNYVPEDKMSNRNGDITKLGENGVDAESTPVGAYRKKVNDAVGKRWHELRSDPAYAPHISYGMVKLKFRVYSNGKIGNSIKIEKQEASSIVTEFTMKAIREANIPPMPTEVREYTGSKGLEIKYSIVIY
ncbi:MAG: hypothetical protein AAF226_09730 [Verrucomicrobiota bacterium]